MWPSLGPVSTEALRLPLLPAMICPSFIPVSASLAYHVSVLASLVMSALAPLQGRQQVFPPDLSPSYPRKKGKHWPSPFPFILFNSP